MFQKYKNELLVLGVILVLHYLLNTVENMAPVNYPTWKSGKDNHMMTPTDILNVRNTTFECSATNKLGCLQKDNYTNDYTKSNYNPAHLDQNTNESVYTTYENPDNFAGYNYH
jgi:hypothetical protein